MILLAFALAVQAPSRPSDSPPWPACRNGASECLPWERAWEPVDESHFTPVIWIGEQTWSIQTRSLADTNQRSRPRAWVRVDYESPNEKGQQSEVTLFSFDCSERRVAQLHQTYYSASGQPSDVQESADIESAYTHIVPGSVISAIAAFFCPA